MTPRKLNIGIPVSVFDTADSTDDSENWDPDFVDKMKEVRKQDLEGKGKTLREIKEQLCIKSLFLEFDEQAILELESTTKMVI